jgi:hypothetical protein
VTATTECEIRQKKLWKHVDTRSSTAAAKMAAAKMAAAKMAAAKMAVATVQLWRLHPLLLIQPLNPLVKLFQHQFHRKNLRLTILHGCV